MLKIKKITRRNGQVEYYPVDRKLFYNIYFKISCNPTIYSEEDAKKWFLYSDAERFRYFGATVIPLCWDDPVDILAYKCYSLEECREILSYIEEYLKKEKEHRKYMEEYFNGQKISKEEYID